MQDAEMYFSSFHFKILKNITDQQEDVYPEFQKFIAYGIQRFNIAIHKRFLTYLKSLTKAEFIHIIYLLIMQNLLIKIIRMMIIIIIIITLIKRYSSRQN